MSEIAGGIREREARGWNREDGIARRELHEGSAGGNRTSEIAGGIREREAHEGSARMESRGWNRKREAREGIA